MRGKDDIVKKLIRGMQRIKRGHKKRKKKKEKKSTDDVEKMSKMQREVEKVMWVGHEARSDQSWS